MFEYLINTLSAAQGALLHILWVRFFLSFLEVKETNRRE